jgi:UV DNA damage repair endonuclease
MNFRRVLALATFGLIATVSGAMAQDASPRVDVHPQVHVRTHIRNHTLTHMHLRNMSRTHLRMDRMRLKMDSRMRMRMGRVNQKLQRMESHQLRGHLRSLEHFRIRPRTSFRFGSGSAEI